MNNKHTRQTEAFVYVNARIWTGVDIDGLLAIPVDEFIDREDATTSAVKIAFDKDSE
jgi:hypothetical protein